MINVAKKCPRFVACLLLLLICGFLTGATTNAQYKVATVSEKTLRKFAKMTVMPEYPADSKTDGSQGVVVAELNINEEGVVKKVQILEAPDDSIGNAVIKATSRWTFQPAIDDSSGKAIRLVGKLTFYYVIDGSGAYVRNPK